MTVSKRIESMQFSPIRKLTKYAEDAERKGLTVYHLNIGQPDILTPDEFFKGIACFHDRTLKYTNSAGIEPLINSFRKYYDALNIHFDYDELLITNGGSEALLFIFMAICDPNDEVIIPEPFYTNYNGFAQAAGVNVVPFLTKAEEGFHLPNKQEIVSKITNKTKAILITNPGNPTGVVYSYDEIRMLADIAKEYNLYLIADEVYREFIYDDLEFTSCMYMDDILEKVILVDSISKRYSACGARIGVVASKNKYLINQILKLCQCRLCVPILEQYGAMQLINTPKEYFTEVHKKYEYRRNILYSSLSKIEGVVCKKPKGAFYVIVKLPIEDAEHFSKWLLTDFSYENQTLIVAPAAGFYATEGLGKNEIRMSYCIDSDKLEKAMEVFTIALERYKKR